MKCKSIWEVNTREVLTAKRRTMVITNQEVEDDVVTSTNHVTIVIDTKRSPVLKTMLRMLHPDLKKAYKLQLMN